MPEVASAAVRLSLSVGLPLPPNSYRALSSGLFLGRFRLLFGSGSLRFFAASDSLVTVSGRRASRERPAVHDSGRGLFSHPGRKYARRQNPSGNCQLGNYQWWTDLLGLRGGFPALISKRWAPHTIFRTYSRDEYQARKSASSRFWQALGSSASLNHLHVVMGYFVQSFRRCYDISNPTNQAQIQSELLTSVNNYKNYPAVLMWAIGNEQNLQNNGNNQPALVQLGLNTLAGSVKAADPNHPGGNGRGRMPAGRLRDHLFQCGKCGGSSR